jgi:TonB family protein
MIPRTLVPVNLRPLSPEEAKKPARRLTTYLDDRTVVPPELSDAPPLDGKTSIPAYMPLDVLVNRTFIPRDMPAKPLERIQPESGFVSIAVLGSRIVVPAYVEPLPERAIEIERPPEMTPELLEVVEPDVFITGDANLLIEPQRKTDPIWDLISRSLSVVFHIGLIIFLVFAPKIFPAHVPTRDEIDLARRQLSFVYMPPDVDELTKRPPGPPAPKIHIDPNTLNTVAPPRPESHMSVAPPVNPERPPSDLPEAPKPQPSYVPPVQNTQPTHLEPIRPPDNPSPGKLNLQLPNSSPGKALQNQIEDAIRRKGNGGGLYTAPGGGIPGGGGGGRGGRGGPGMQPGVTMLTPTEGVDFDSYLRRLVDVVRRNWYAILPESALMGDKGIVVLTFHVNRDGSVSGVEPILERTSGKQPLDAAAMSSIRASSPFEPLPQQFKGPNIELRFIYFYNLPVDYSY